MKNKLIFLYPDLHHQFFIIAINSWFSLALLNNCNWYMSSTRFISVVYNTTGNIGIVMVSNWSQPKDPNNPRDIEAAERTNQLKIGWFTNPIFGNGDYPTILKAQLASKAKELGLPASPLPVFTDDEKKFIRGVFRISCCVMLTVHKKCVSYILLCRPNVKSSYSVNY